MSLEHIFGPPVPDEGGASYPHIEADAYPDEPDECHDAAQARRTGLSSAVVSGLLGISTLAHVAASLSQTEATWWHSALAALFAVAVTLAAATGPIALAAGALLIAAATGTPPVAAWIGAPLLALATARLVWSRRQGLR